jgi:hypothetical protein
MTDRTRKILVYLGDAASQATAAQLGELVNLGWMVNFISAHRPMPGTALHPGIKYRHLPVSADYPLTYAAFLFAAPLILSLKPDIVHACGLSSYGIMAAVHRRFLRFKPMVLTVSGPDILKDARQGMTRWSAEHALKMFEAVVTAEDDEILAELDRMAISKDRLMILNADNAKTTKTAAEQLAGIYTRLLSGDGQPENF